MHSSKELTSNLFNVTLKGERCRSFADLLPGFSVQDRLGIVIREPMQAVWASGLIMSAVTAFYDIHRQSGERFFIYPDYFMFGIDCVPGDYGMLDIWPDHKRITVAPTAEACLQAINDRAVTVLLVPETTPAEPKLERQTRSSALARLKLGLVYRPNGVIEDSDVQVTCPAVVEGYVEKIVQNTPGLTEAEREALRRQRRVASMVEYYRRVTPAEALTYLTDDDR